MIKKLSIVIVFSVGLVISSSLAQDNIGIKGNLNLSVEKQISDQKQMISADSLFNIGRYEKAAKKYYQIFINRATDIDENIRATVGVKYYKSLMLQQPVIEEAEKIRALQEVYSYCQDQNNLGCLGIVLKDFGRFYQRRNPVLALQNFNKAEKILESLKDSINLVQLYNDKAILLRLNEEHERAAGELQKAIHYLSENCHEEIVLRTYTRFLRELQSFYDEVSLNKWLSIYEKATSLCADEKEFTDICTTIYINGAHLLTMSGKPDKAIEIIEDHIDLKALQTKKTSLEPVFPAYCMYVKGLTLQKLGQYKKALDNLSGARENAMKKKDTALMLLVSNSMSDIYLKQNRYQLAAASFKEERRLADFQNKKILKNRLKLNAIVANLEKEQKIQVQQSKIRNLSDTNKDIVQSNTFLQNILYIGVIIFMTIILIFMYRLNGNKMRLLKLKEEATLNKLKLLQSAMNPHFLFNTFGALQHYILSKDSLKANEYMTELSGLIRNIFYSSEKSHIRLFKELEILKSYIALEQGRFENPFEVNFEVSPHLVEENPYIPPMIIQPHVENSIKHGFVLDDRTYYLSLTFRKEENHIVCDIIDDGIGRKASSELQRDKFKRRKHLSIATKSTKERLSLIKQVDGSDSSIDILDIQNESGNIQGTKVTIVLPIKQNRT